MNALLITPRSSMSSLLLSVVLLFVTGAAGAQADPLITTRPPKPVRIPAEFEPRQAVIVQWLPEADAILYTSLAQDVKIIVLADPNESTRANVEERFGEYGIDPNKYEIIDVSYEPVANRDLLGWSAFVDHNQPALIYNQVAGGKYEMPQYGLAQGYAVYRSGLRVEGGDFMTDGQGAAFTFDHVVGWVQNVDVRSEFPLRVWDFWGVDRYYSLEDLAPVVIAHVDCQAKLISPDTIMIARYTGREEHFAYKQLHQQAEAIAARCRRLVSCYGTPYSIVRVDVMDDVPYTNSLIVNRRVFVPILDGGPADANALATYEAAMPGYEVIGITNDAKYYWNLDFALHCYTMGIADWQMLYIKHIPLLNRPPTSDGFPISAEIEAFSQTEFVDGTPVVWWWASDDPNALGPEADPNIAWSNLAMTFTPELGDHQYRAYIPVQPVGTVVQYYLQAKDASGRDETHPYIGRAQAHTFTVTTLGANVSAVSAERGGTVELYINAGLDSAGQNYRLVYCLPTDPNLAESSHEALPDATAFTGFEGRLDEFGIASAQMVLPGGLESDWVQTTVHLRLEMPGREDAVLETLSIQILE